MVHFRRVVLRIRVLWQVLDFCIFQVWSAYADLPAGGLTDLIWYDDIGAISNIALNTDAADKADIGDPTKGDQNTVTGLADNKGIIGFDCLFDSLDELIGLTFYARKESMPCQGCWNTPAGASSSDLGAAQITATTNLEYSFQDLYSQDGDISPACAMTSSVKETLTAPDGSSVDSVVFTPPYLYINPTQYQFGSYSFEIETLISSQMNYNYPSTTVLSFVIQCEANYDVTKITQAYIVKDASVSVSYAVTDSNSCGYTPAYSTTYVASWLTFGSSGSLSIFTEDTLTTKGTHTIPITVTDNAMTDFGQPTSTVTREIDVIIEPCIPSVFKVIPSDGTVIPYTILAPPIVLRFATEDANDCGYTETFQIVQGSTFASLLYSTSSEGRSLQACAECGQQRLLAAFENYVTIDYKSLDLAGTQRLEITSTTDDMTYGASSNSVISESYDVELTDPCESTTLGLAAQADQMYFASANYTVHQTNLSGLVFDLISQENSLTEFCGPFQKSVISLPSWLSASVSSDLQLSVQLVEEQYSAPLEDIVEISASLINYPTITTTFQISVSLVIISRSDTALSYAADNEKLEVTLPELQIQSISPLEYSKIIQIQQSTPAALTEVSDPLWMLGEEELPEGGQQIVVRTIVEWGSISQMWWTEVSSQVSLEVAPKQINADVSISENAFTKEDTEIDLSKFNPFSGSATVELLEEGGLQISAISLSLKIASPTASGLVTIKCNLVSTDYPRLAPQLVIIDLTLEDVVTLAPVLEVLDEEEEEEEVELEIEEEVQLDWSHLFPISGEDQNKEDVQVVPYLRLLPFSFTGLLTVKSTCVLKKVDDLDILFLPIIPFGDKKVPTLALNMIWEDPEFIAENGFGNFTVKAQNMTDKSFVLNFTFPRPDLISTLGHAPDKVEVQLLSPLLLMCKDGRQFTNNVNAMTASLPLQAGVKAQEFLTDADTTVADAKMATIFILIFNLVSESGTDVIMGTLNFIGFLAIEFGVGIQYPSVSMGFFGMLLSLINFDLLSEFKEFDVPYDPQFKLAEQLTPNVGFIGFETCSILLNFGSLVWFICIYIVQVFFLTCCSGRVLIRLPRKVSSKIRNSREKTFWNGILTNLNDNMLVFFMAAMIRMMRIIATEQSLVLGIEDALMVLIIVGLPIVYCVLSLVLYWNYAALQNPDSSVSQRVGEQMSGVKVDQVSALIGVPASQLTQIRTFSMIFIIVVCTQYSGLQLCLFILLPILETIFLIYFVPFEPADQRTNVIMILEASFFNYLLLTQSDFLIDTETKNIVAWGMVAFVCGITVYALVVTIVVGLIAAINACRNCMLKKKRAAINKKIAAKKTAQIQNRLKNFENYASQAVKRLPVSSADSLTEPNQSQSASKNATSSTQEQKVARQEAEWVDHDRQKVESILEVLKTQIRDGESFEEELPPIDDLFLANVGFGFAECSAEQKAEIIRQSILNLVQDTKDQQAAEQLKEREFQLLLTQQQKFNQVINQEEAQLESSEQDDQSPKIEKKISNQKLTRRRALVSVFDQRVENPHEVLGEDGVLHSIPPCFNQTRIALAQKRKQTQEQIESKLPHQNQTRGIRQAGAGFSLNISSE